MPTTDVASLAFSIDSSQAVTSMDALAKLQERAAGVAQQKREVTRASDEAGQSFSRQRTSAQALTVGLTDLVTVQNQAALATARTANVFDDLNAKLVEAQRHIGDVAGGTEKFIQANRQAESVARMFGQTSDALVAYIGRTNDLKLAADATASSLDRITRALENQTQAGAQVRAVMSQYGVDLSKIAMNEPDKAVGAFIDNARKYRDTPAKTRDIQAVMGPMSPDDLNTLMSPAYVPMEDRKARDEALDASSYISRMFSDINFRQRQRELDEAETADFRKKYNDPNKGSQSADLAEFRRIAALPIEERNPFTRDTIPGVPGSGGDSEPGGWWSYINSGRYSANDALLREQRNRDSFEGGAPLWQGFLGATAGRAAGYLGAQGRYVVQSAKNFFDAADLPEPADQRPEDPYAQSRREITLASRLASYGETGFMGAAGSRFRALRMEKEDARGAFREAYDGQGPTQAQLNELAAARPEAERTRATAANTAERVRPSDLNSREFDGRPDSRVAAIGAAAASVGQARLDAALATQASLDAGDAPLGRLDANVVDTDYQRPPRRGLRRPSEMLGLRPDVEQLPPGPPELGPNRAASIAAAAAAAAQTRLDRANADVQAAQARQRDADQRYDNLVEINRTVGRYSERPEERVADATAQGRWVTGMQSGDRAFADFALRQAGQMNVPTTRIENYSSGQDFVARGGFTDSQRNVVQQAWEGEAATRSAGRQENLNDQIDLNNRLRDAVAQGGAAVEKAQVAWTAMAEIRKKGGDIAEQNAAAETALAERYQRNATAVEQSTQALKDRNEALERQAAMTTGLTGLDRVAAGNEAQIANIGIAAERGREGSGAGAEEQERRRMGAQARLSGDQILATTREQLTLELQVGAASGARAEVMEKIRRDAQVDLQFQQALAGAIASGNQAEIDALRTKVSLVKEMRDQVAAIQAAGALTQQLRVIGDQGRAAAQTEGAVMGLPREDRGRARAVIGALDVEGERFGGAYRAGRMQAYGTLPGDLRAEVESRTEGLPEAARQAIRGTFGAEAPQGADAYRSPSQITPPAYQEIQNRRAAARQQPLMSLEDLRKPENWRENVAAGIEYFEILRAQGGGDAAYAAAGYGPDGQRGLSRYRATGSTADLSEAQLRRMTLAGYNPTGVDMATRYGRTPDGERAVQGAGAAYDARTQADDDRLWEQYGDRVGVRGAYLTATRQGETGRAQLIQAGVYNPEDPSGRTKALQAQGELRFGFQAQFQAQVGEAERDVQMQRDLGVAYGESSAKVQEVTIAYKAMAEQKRTAMSDTDREILQEKLLQQARQQTLTQVAADIKRDKDQAELYGADASVPWFAGPQTRGRARAKAETDLYIRDRGIEGTQEADDKRASTELKEINRAIAEDQQTLRQGFLQMGQAAQSAFADAVLGGKNLQQTLNALVNDWARLALNMASKQGFSMIGDLITGGLKLLGGGGAAPVAAGGTVGATSIVAGIGLGPVASAAGNAFDQGERLQMYAAGEVIDRPTTFGMKDKRTAMVGEAGRPEGIFPLTRTRTGALGVQVASPQGEPGQRLEPMPLTRLPNGDLAVQMPGGGQRTQMFASGGVVGGSEGGAIPRPMALPTPVATGGRAGGGRDVQVVNNMTFNGGGGGAGGAGKIDPKAAREFQDQIAQATKAAVMQILADEKRQGGMLYG